MIARVIAVFLAILIAQLSPTHAQELPLRLESNGTDLMQGLCEFHGIQPIVPQNIDEVGKDQLIFILLGDVSRQPGLAAKVARWTASGLGGPDCHRE